MRSHVRLAALLTVPVALATVLCGCSGEGGGRNAAAPSEPVEASASFGKVDVGEPAGAPGAGPAPLLVVGTRGPFDVFDEAGEAVRTRMSVKVESAKYVTAADLGTANDPVHGQYLVLTLTLKNVGKAPGRFAARGAMQWQDAKTSLRDCTTGESVEGPDLDAEYRPGQAVTGSVVLDVPRHGGTVTYYDGPGRGSFAVLLPE
ncbi:DUF4352 domain-containing protein [Streptomyces sp. SGAir0957]